MISMICVSCSLVILDMLNTFVKNYNYFKAKVNNILINTYKNDLITSCCLKCTEMLFSHWLIWRWRLLNKHYRLRKMEMEVFVKTPVISTVPYNFIKGNKILQPNILIYFNTNFNVIQRTMIVMGGGDGGF